MAIFHLSVKTVSRSAGRSATAAAAYRAAEEITCEREGRVHDYTRKQGVAHTEIIIPHDATWAVSREALWNKAELAETRKNSTVAREYEIALPAELSGPARIELTRDFARAISQRYGVAADIAVHAPNRDRDARNWHAHILTTTRRVTAEGLGAKTRILDDQKTGPAQVSQLRSLWAEMTNQALERHGHEQRVTEKSYASILEEKHEALAQTAEGSTERVAAQKEVLRVHTLAENLAPHLGSAVAAMEARERRRAEHEGRDYEPTTQIGAEMHRASRVRETLRGYLQAFGAYARESYALAHERFQLALSLFGGERRSATGEQERGALAAPEGLSRRAAEEAIWTRGRETATPALDLQPGETERGSFLERREQGAHLEGGREPVARAQVPDAGAAPTREDPLLKLARSILAQDDQRPAARRQEDAAASPPAAGVDVGAREAVIAAKEAYETARAVDAARAAYESARQAQLEAERVRALEEERQRAEAQAQKEAERQRGQSQGRSHDM
ncbi:MobQ family relaxase [Methylocystis iwaonis]|uniref:MobQ family relaxase n=1 Tax=Methylocystis iwaonis TaxID=2885079 RepID=UPI002E7B966E|nr:MobQ family relaxase [Methylocystis iwaonis]